MDLRDEAAPLERLAGLALGPMAEEVPRVMVEAWDQLPVQRRAAPGYC